MNRVKFTVVGDAGTGKSSLLSVLQGEGYTKSRRPGRLPTFTKVILVNDTEYELEIWDTTGSNESEKDRIHSYRNTDVFLMCFAENDTISFKNIVAKWYPEIRTHRAQASTVLVCTKCDIKSKRIPAEEVINVKRRCNSCMVAFSSALSGRQYIEEIFRDTILNLYEKPIPKKTIMHKFFVRCTSKEDD